MSMMKEMNANLNQRIAARVRELRASRQLSLDTLARKSEVSRSMISLIERGESSPTAVVLEKVAAGLGVTLGSLFNEPASSSLENVPLARRADQSEWKDPASGYIRRNVSPPGVYQPMQIVDVQFPAGERVAFETVARTVPVYQQVWMLEGSMEVTTGRQVHLLHKGDCLAMQLDSPTVFHNPTRKAARYAVVIAAEMPARRHAL